MIGPSMPRRLAVPARRRGVSDHVSFTCATCGHPAGGVELIPPGVPDPRLLGAAEAPPGIDHVAIDDYRLSITGPVSVTISPAAPAKLREAIAAGDAAWLYELDHEWAPFWCPGCRRCYCADHFKQEVTYDDGFFDAIYGTCPAGHLRKLMD
jgi:hypothetical protein